MKSTTVQVGDPIPSFSLPALDGRNVHSADVPGAALILVFFRGSWCPACRWQLGHLRDRHEEFDERDATIVAISADPRTAALDTPVTASLPYPVLSDEHAETIAAFGLGQVDAERDTVIARPAVFVLDLDRIVRYAFVGEHPRDRPTVGSLLLAIDHLASR